MKRTEQNIKKKKVLVAMSGGVDSSVAALLMKKNGYEVFGAFMKCFSDTKNNLTGECAWRDELRMARRIAAKLNIQLIMLDFEKEYKKHIIESMFKAYTEGKTPNPDILCNKIIKFPLLWKAAKKLKIPLIATGHYARIKKTSNGFQLLTGLDFEKDQSYFLAEISQEDLSHTIFPLGNHTKSQVRQIAKANNFPNWDKQGTRGICFVGRIPMQKFLKQKIKEKRGKIISPKGELIGMHPGSAFFTIGQKLGEHLGVIINKPPELAQKRFYVAEKRKGNILVAVPENHSLLKRKRIIIKKLHLINQKVKIPLKLKARIRHPGIFHSGKLKKVNSGWEFRFDKLIKAIAEGQYIVFYKDQEVMGCGEIILR
jgi:tRNA-specific 2-thiouridylase